MRPARPHLALLSLALAACATHHTASDLAKAPSFDPKGQSKCSLTKSQAEPLIVEWPSAARAKLESRVKRGLVAVRYEGCAMELLSECTATGIYKYTGTERKEDRVTIKDADDLYANVPVGAAALEAKLAKAGELNVAMTIVGRYEADRGGPRRDELAGGDCERATHVIAAITVGAFDFFAGANAELAGGVSVAGAGAGARSVAARETLKRDGESAACVKATRKDVEPPEGCGAMLRVEVVPIAGAASAASKSEPAARPPATPIQAPAPSPPSATAPTAAPAPPVAADVAMASIHGGTFRMGQRGDTVTLAPFSLDATEVTVGAYAECVRKGSCTAPATEDACNFAAVGRENHPINCVDWHQASAYCAARGKRLPTEEEWEWAARGQERATAYPWGNDVPGAQLCWAAKGRKANRQSTCPVGSFPRGDAPGAIHDLAGNVWEWTSSPKGADERVIRGGAWVQGEPEDVRAAYRYGARSDARLVSIGFRCAR